MEYGRRERHPHALLHRPGMSLVVGARAQLKPLQRFAPMATVEVAMICQLTGQPAPAELWRLASKWRVSAEPVLTGELWSPAAPARG
jgi:hypothetical protein